MGTPSMMLVALGQRRHVWVQHPNAVLRASLMQQAAAAYCQPYAGGLDHCYGAHVSMRCSMCRP